MSLLLIGSVLLGGAAIGALARQPEVNRLKAQVRELQEEIQRLQRIVQEQDRQIKELKIRYEALKVYQIMERMKQKSRVRGSLIFQYAFMEYLDLLVMRTHDEEELQEEQQLFFNIFDKIINGKVLSVEEKMLIREYIIDKYHHQVTNLIEPDSKQVLERIDNIYVA